MSVVMPNRTKVTPKKREKFLLAIGRTANVSRAALSIGVAREHLYRLREADPEFKVLWDSAVERGTDALEDEATRRGVAGYDEPVFYQGKKTGTVRKYSDTLLIVQLKARRPAKYRENVSTVVSGPNGGPIQSVVLATTEPDTARAYLKMVSG